MYIKHIILLCLTLYIPTTKSSIDEEEITNLWKALSGRVYGVQIIYDIAVYNVYFDEDRKELEAIMKTYGHKYTLADETGYKFTFDAFKKAASDGYIHRWSKEAMQNIFNEIIPEGVSRNYATNDDMTRYYKKRHPELQLDINKIMRDHGKLSNNGYVFNLHHFRRAINNGILPEPLCDERASLVAVYTAFEKMNDLRGEVIYEVDHTDFIRYYSSQLEKITIDYGRDYNGKMVLNFDDFKNAIDNGHLLVSSSGVPSSTSTSMDDVFNNMLPDKDGARVVTYIDLLKCYVPQIKNVIENNGHEKDGAYSLYYYQFRKVIVKGLLPLKLYSK